MTRINRCALKGSQNGVMDQLELLFFKLLLVIWNDVHLFITFLIERCLEYLLSANTLLCIHILPLSTEYWQWLWHGRMTLPVPKWITPVNQLIASVTLIFVLKCSFNMQIKHCSSHTAESLVISLHHVGLSFCWCVALDLREGSDGSFWAWETLESRVKLDNAVLVFEIKDQITLC